ncbi:ExbD/TolR family protein [Pedobacter montanisoli]|uniref:Biopolymer transporter ExbD n=1 Tax=Pedobacter montanisoli TaxID=2923277 RepID=A0ABS9ZV15_9SPHI|nr:biopolymer transporter ExbD [Pedobacter montanisoli]MCJ0741909.1 biopolymer transporter ExbD [Pedobacter montanisoli]
MSSSIKLNFNMATLTNPRNGKAVKGKSKTLAPGIDLTAMVDLAFLLITFFMLTTSLSKMNAMEIAKPVNSNESIDLAESRTMTILLGKNNQAAYYMGEPGKAVMHQTDLSGIQKQITQNKKIVAQKYHNDASKFMIVIIKPTSGSNYKNFVDIMDEVHIGSIQSYFIDDKNILEQEKVFMKQRGI